MSESVRSADARKAAAAAAFLSRSAEELQRPDARGWIERVRGLSTLCESVGSRTSIAALGTALLAKASNPRIDACSLTPTDTSTSGSYCARQVASVLAEVAREHSFDIGTAGREPLNNQPFMRSLRISRDMLARPQWRPAVQRLSDLCHEVNQLGGEDALRALAAFVHVRSAYVSVRPPLVVASVTPYSRWDGFGRVAPWTYPKAFLARLLANHVEIFRELRDSAAGGMISTGDGQSIEGCVEVIARFLGDKLERIPPGVADAVVYQRLVVCILEFLFYPDLVSPCFERPLHQGRKRVDISFDNVTHRGFFWRLHAIYGTPAHYIFVECKNSKRGVANPAVDQLAGRFSPQHGMCGLLLCRATGDLRALVNRCHDTYRDRRGIILPLTDLDLMRMLELAREGVERPYEAVLADRFRDVCLGESEMRRRSVRAQGSGNR